MICQCCSYCISGPLALVMYPKILKASVNRGSNIEHLLLDWPCIVDKILYCENTLQSKTILSNRDMYRPSDYDIHQ